jgi:hypothetical protein
LERIEIGVPEFRERLAAICLGGVGPGLPRRRRDAHILLKSVALALRDGQRYSEPDLDDALESWLWEVGARVEVDRLTLRRALVDEGYLERDPAGHEYRLGPGRRSVAFAAGVDGTDPLDVVRQARHAVERKREEHERRRRGAA